jgi:hypothetical protein
MNNRNNLCFCGSGKKTKNCHKNKSASSLINIRYLSFIIFLLLFWIFMFESGSDTTEDSVVEPYKPLRSKNNLSSKSKPLDITHEGKIWSYEHNHWHDDPNYKKVKNQSIHQDPKNIGSPKNKVWSPEHNHWH